MFPERHARTEQAGSNGIYRKLQDIRNLGITQLLVFPQHDDFSFGCVQLRNGVADKDVHFDIPSGLTTRLAGERTIRFASLSSLGKDEIERNAVQVCSDGRPRLIPAAASHDGQECLLGEVFRSFAIQETSAKEGKQGNSVAVKQLAESRLRATLKIEQQCFVGDHYAGRKQPRLFLKL
jgi:hypothetical protein